MSQSAFGRRAGQPLKGPGSATGTSSCATAKFCCNFGSRWALKDKVIHNFELMY